jgi:membrane protein implicated in regulation of membrane protease activity
VLRRLGALLRSPGRRDAGAAADPGCVVAELLGEGGFSLAPFLAGVLYGILPALTLVFAVAALVPLLAALAWLRRAVDAAEREVEVTALSPERSSSP